MTTKQRLILTLALTLLAQAACAPSANACPTPTPDTKLLTNTEDGYCLLYPAEASSDMPGWVVINPISAPGDVPGEAWVNIHVQDAAGRTAAQFGDEARTAAGTGFNITLLEVQVDGGPAIVVDGLPGLDSNRMVLIVRNDRLYTLTFMPWFPNAAAPTPLENLFTTVMDTLHFLPPTKLLPTPTQPWGPANLPPPLSFVTPQDGQALAFEGDYFFQVNDIGADGYLWSFTQNGEVVWENLRDESGYTSGGTYAILAGSPAHDRFVPGAVQVSVRAAKGDYLGEPTVITIILQ